MFDNYRVNEFWALLRNNGGIISLFLRNIHILNSDYIFINFDYLDIFKYRLVTRGDLMFGYGHGNSINVTNIATEVSRLTGNPIIKTIENCNLYAYALNSKVWKMRGDNEFNKIFMNLNKMLNSRKEKIIF